MKAVYNKSTRVRRKRLARKNLIQKVFRVPKAITASVRENYRRTQDPETFMLAKFQDFGSGTKKYVSEIMLFITREEADKWLTDNVAAKFHEEWFVFKQEDF